MNHLELVFYVFNAIVLGFGVFRALNKDTLPLKAVVLSGIAFACMAAGASTELTLIGVFAFALVYPLAILTSLFGTLIGGMAYIFSCNK